MYLRQSFMMLPESNSLLDWQDSSFTFTRGFTESRFQTCMVSIFILSFWRASVAGGIEPGWRTGPVALEFDLPFSASQESCITTCFRFDVKDFLFLREESLPTEAAAPAATTGMATASSMERFARVSANMLIPESLTQHPSEPPTIPNLHFHSA